MTRYYTYIEAGPIIDEATRFYSVAIGESKVAKRDLAFLTRYASQHNHFFRKDDMEVVEFLENIATSLGRDRISRTPINARDFVRDLKRGTRPTLSANQLRNDHHMRFVFDLNYRISCNLACRR